MLRWRESKYKGWSGTTTLNPYSSSIWYVRLTGPDGSVYGERTIYNAYTQKAAVKRAIRMKLKEFKQDNKRRIQQEGVVRF